MTHLPALALAALAVSCSAALSAPKVVASIQPVHSLVASVMAGVGTPELLVPPGASPHDYALKPSDARALAGADLVFWVGPGVSTFLLKPLAELTDASNVVRLSAVPGLHLLPARAGGEFEADAHNHQHEGHDHGDSHDNHSDKDEAGDAPEHPEAHIWLETGNASVMTLAIAAKLSALDPDNADRYRENASRTVERLGDLSTELRELLAPVQDRPFIVFHDAWQHFEREFGLLVVGSITVNPDQPPGVRRISRLKSRIRDMGVVCIFAEPQFDSGLPQTLADGEAIRVGVADPLGATYPSGPMQYEQLMRAAANAFRGCAG